MKQKCQLGSNIIIYCPYGSAWRYVTLFLRIVVSLDLGPVIENKISRHFFIYSFSHYSLVMTQWTKSQVHDILYFPISLSRVQYRCSLGKNQKVSVCICSKINGPVLGCSINKSLTLHIPWRVCPVICSWMLEYFIFVSQTSSSL